MTDWGTKECVGGATIRKRQQDDRNFIVLYWNIWNIFVESTFAVGVRKGIIKEAVLHLTISVFDALVTERETGERLSGRVNGLLFLFNLFVALFSACLVEWTQSS